MRFFPALIALFVLSVVAVLVAFGVGDAMALEITRSYTRIAFYGLIAIFVATVVTKSMEWGAASLKEAAKGYFNLARSALFVFAAACAIFSATREDRGYRVLADEYVLSVEAQQLHREGLSQIPARMHIIDGNLRSLGGSVNKRPPLFVVLLSGLHDIFGYRPQNVFYLNLVLTGAFFVLLGWVSDRLFGVKAAFAACGLWVSFPLLYQNASGGGFELLNLVMLLATLGAGLAYYKRPTDFRLRCFVLLALLLANARYESMLFVVPVGLVVLLKWWRDVSARRVDLVLFLAPVFMAFCVLRLIAFRVNEADNWQMEPGRSPFALTYFADNVGHALNYFFSFNRKSTTSELIFGLGLPALAFYLYGATRASIQGSRRGNDLVLLLFSLTVLANFFVLLLYHWGQLTAPEVSRLSLPFALVCVFAILFLFFDAIKGPVPGRILAGMIAVFLVYIAIPRGASASVTNATPHPKRGEWSLRVVQGMGLPNLVVASSDALLFQVHEIPSVPLTLLNVRLPQLDYHLKLQTFQVVVVQRFTSEGPGAEWVPMPSDRLHPAMKVEEVASAVFSPFTRISVSRLVSLDPERLNDPAPAPIRMGSKEAQERLRRNEHLPEWLNNLP